MRQKRYHSKSVGNDLESEVAKLLDEAGIPYVQESTVTSSKKRTSGSVDFTLKNPIGFLECKRFTKRLSLAFKSKDHDIKWSQVEFLNRKMLEGHISAWVVQESSDKTLIFILQRDLILWWANTQQRSLSLEMARKIGREITDLKFLNVDTSKLDKGEA